MGRERFHLEDQHYLYVCLSTDWNSIERRFIKDILLLRDSGAKVTTVVLDNSSLLENCLQNALDVITIESQLKLSHQQYLLFKKIRFLIHEHEVNLIHCYKYDDILPIALVIKRIPRIPFIYTCHEKILDKYKYWIHDYFITRIDQCLLLSGLIKNAIHFPAPLMPRRIESIGLGLNFKLQQTDLIPKKELSKIGLTCESIDDIYQALDVIKILDQKEDESLKYSFHFFSRFKWDQKSDFVKVRHAILASGFENKIYFSSFQECKSFMKEIDLFLIINERELLTEEEVYAAVYGVPVLVPRTFERTHFVDQYNVGMSYKLGDWREVRIKLENYFHHKLVNISNTAPDLEDLHHEDLYNEKLLKCYEKNFLQRYRYSQMKGRLAKR